MLSLAVHAGVLGSGFLNLGKVSDFMDQEVIFEIDRPECLPDIYRITKEKKIEKNEEPIIPEDTEEIAEDDIREKNSQEEEIKKSLLRYQDSIKQKIQESKRYPRWAIRAKHQGIAGIIFDVLSSGAIQNLKVVRSSGFEILDIAALEAVRRATPFAAFPEILDERVIRITVDIVFALDIKN